MTQNAVLVAAGTLIAVATFVALRRHRADPPPVVVTITADTARFLDGVRAVARATAAFGASWAEVTIAARRASLAFAINGQAWVRGMHAPLEVEPGEFVCGQCRVPAPCREYRRLTESIADLRRQLDETRPRTDTPTPDAVR